MPISLDFSSIYTKNWEINFAQCLPNGYLKYTDLCNILQLTAAAHSEVGGISFSDMDEFNQAWVLSRMRVEIDALPKWKDTVTVRTWINTLENSRSVRVLELYVNGLKMIGCATFWVVFNTKTRRPETLALPYEHFELYPEMRATKKSISKINFTNESEMALKKTVAISDLDILNHVNNVKYLEWCLDLLDVNLIINQKIESFEMNFFKELSLHDNVSIFKNNTAETMIFNINKDDNTCFALQLNLK
jgi:acyl-ACP thioesterase